MLAVYSNANLLPLQKSEAKSKLRTFHVTNHTNQVLDKFDACPYVCFIRTDAVKMPRFIQHKIILSCSSGQRKLSAS